MDRIRKEVWEGDLAELKASGNGYMPTAFPGLLLGQPAPDAAGHDDDRSAQGEFYWRQFAIFRELGIRTVFVGMFDEVNEGTAIYKVANQTPVGKYFVTYEGLPSDWYLKLTGAATRMIRGDAPLSTYDPGEVDLGCVRCTVDARAKCHHGPAARSGCREHEGRLGERDFGNVRPHGRRRTYVGRRASPAPLISISAMSTRSTTARRCCCRSARGQNPASIRPRMQCGLGSPVPRPGPQGFSRCDCLLGCKSWNRTGRPGGWTLHCAFDDDGGMSWNDRRPNTCRRQ